MHILIKLVNHEDVVQYRYSFECDSQDTLKKLKDSMSSNRPVERKYLQWFFENGSELDDLEDSTLKSLGVTHASKLIVRHSMSENWKKFVAKFETARQALAEKQTIQAEEAVDQAVNLLLPIIESKYVVTYPRLHETYCQFRVMFSWELDLKRKSQFEELEVAAHNYFSKVFVENNECSDIIIKCRQTTPIKGRAQARIICQVFRNRDVIGKYYVQKYLPFSSQKNIRKMFVYKLFELIGVGPKVHFIPYETLDSSGLYVVTDEIPGFWRANVDDIEISTEVYAQRDFLRRVLLIYNLHSGNYGIDENGKLNIVNFSICDHEDPRIVDIYLNRPKSWKKSKEHQIQMAMDNIKLWNLPDSFDKANEAISSEKELFKMHPGQFDQIFEKYFVQIKHSLDYMIEGLRSAS